MEPAQVTVITHYETVESVTSSDLLIDWFFKLKGIPASFYVQKPVTLAVGDRVKITITKEPSADAS